MACIGIKLGLQSTGREMAACIHVINVMKRHSINFGKGDGHKKYRRRHLVPLV